MTSLVINECDVHFASHGELKADLQGVPGSDGPRVLSAGFGLSADPGVWWIGEAQVRSLNLFWSGEGGTLSSLQGSRLGTSGFSVGDDVRVSDGVFVASGFPAMRLETVEGRVEEKRFKIVKARLHRDEPERSGDRSASHGECFIDCASNEAAWYPLRRLDVST